MARQQWSKINAILLAFSFWMFWNFWLSLFFATSLFLFATTSDFLANFYTAGQSWLSQANPYANSSIVFVYPPTSLPFFGFFALFNFETAASLWTVTYFSLFVIAGAALAYTIKGEGRSLFLCLTVLLFFSSYPILAVVELSQADLLVASITILALVAERLQRRYLSAFLLALAVLLKMDPVFLLIYFVIFRRDLKYLARFIVFLAGLVGVSLFIVPIQWYWYYIVKVVPTLYSQYSLESSESIVRFLSYLGLSKAELQAISMLGVGVFALFAFYVNSNRWKNCFAKKTIRAEAMFLMNGLVILFFSPRSLIYPYAWGVLPLALFLSSLMLADCRATYLLLVGIAGVLLSSQPTGWTGYFLNSYFVSMVVPTLMIGNLMFIISMILIYVCPNTIFHSVKKPFDRRK
ncbi:MAG: glycosyltransferase family 87 protein [Candidatus Bathyarchaeia archaeon]